MKAIDELTSILGSRTDDKSVHAQALLAVIQNAASLDEKIEMMSVTLSERDNVAKNPKNLPNKGMSADEWDKLLKTHADMIDGYLKMAFFKNQTLKGFAEEILRLIDFFSEPSEKTFAFAKSLYSPYVPYHQLPGTPIHMTNAEYTHKLQSEQKRVELIHYIMELPFS